MSAVQLLGTLPGLVHERVATGLSLADRHAQVRGQDAATPGEGRAFIAAYSLAACRGVDAAQLVSKVANDGGDLIKALDSHGHAPVAKTLKALSQARKAKPVTADAIGITETLAQVGKVFDPVHSTPMWDHWAPIEEAPEFGRNEYVSLRIEPVGEARPNGDTLDNGDTVELNTARRSTRIAYFTLRTSQDPLTLAQAAFQGINYNGMSDLAARLILKQRLAHYLLYSEGAYNWDGALAINTPIEGDGTALASATVAETVDGVLLVLSGFEAAAADGLGPNRVAISQKVWTKLAGQYGTNSSISGRDYLAKAYPEIQWAPGVYLNDRTDFDSGTKHAMIVSHVGPLGVRAVTAREPMVIAYQEGINTRALYVQPFAGLHFAHKSNVQAGDFAV